MAEVHYPTPHHQTQHDEDTQNRAHQMVKAATAVTAGGSLLVISGLILAATVIGLTVATPLFVIFSPVLVPAVITVALVSLGFLTSGGFGVAAITVLSWIYRYVTGKHPAGSDQLDIARHKLTGKARELRDYGRDAVTGHGGQGS
ncbi:hypothetical protein L6164_005649 [Bauhinia variegata]|uniref:Uncharacterized protein n=1 Tax=Bauhinia variegata TaxID=167791 RepID=A0ACB9PRX9_BAUVA|nr:hypothetical protein L6164_005649 [Bauhinia variegata]